MNTRKWRGKDYPPSVWVAKLAEEVGEVARLFSEPDEHRLLMTRKQRKAAIEELQHVEFIARQFRLKLEVDQQMGERNV